MKTSAAQPQGPMLIGTLLGLCLAGVITVQSYVYLTTYQKRDKAWLRLFIAFLLALNIVHTSMQFAYLYVALVRHYDDPGNLLKVTPVFALTATVTGMISFSDELVDRIIRATIQTGLITALCALVDLIIYLTDTRGLHLAPNFALGKLYTSTLMSSLNARSVWSYDDANNAPSSGRVTPGIISTSEVRLSSRSTSGPPPVLPEVKSFHGTRDQEKLARTASRSDVYKASTCDSPSSSLPPKEFVSVQV